MDIRPIGISVQPGASMPERATFVSEPSGAPAAAPAIVETAVQQPDAAAHLAAVTQAVKDINKAMEGMSQGLEFSVDSDTQETVVKVVDQATKEVIRQMPSKEALEIAKALDQAQGLLIRQKA